MTLRHTNGDGEALALAKAKISLNQAIDNALLAVPGQALSAELNDDHRDEKKDRD